MKTKYRNDSSSFKITQKSNNQNTPKSFEDGLFIIKDMN